MINTFRSSIFVLETSWGKSLCIMYASYLFAKKYTTKYVAVALQNNLAIEHFIATFNHNFKDV